MSMLNKKTTVFFAVFLAAVMLFSSCGGHGNGDDVRSTAESTGTSMPDVAIVSDGKSKFTIIRSDYDTDEAKLAVTLRNAIRDETGVTLPIKTDFSEKDIADYEIIVGETTREEKFHEFSGRMASKDFAIIWEGNRIWIRGGSYTGTKSAVEYFISNYVSSEKKEVALPESVCLYMTGDYPVKKLSIAGNDISEYTIVYSPSDYLAASELQRCIEASTGQILNMSREKPPDGHVINVGYSVSDSGLDLSGLGDEGLVISVDGGNLNLSGGSETQHGTLYAVYEFLRKYVGFNCYTADVQAALPAESIDVPETTDYRKIPAFEYRQILWDGVLFNVNLSAQQFVNGDWGVSGTESYSLHDFYAGPSAHTLAALAGVAETAQPCLTSPAVYQTVLENVMKTIEQYPGAKFVSVSQNDNYDYCKCESCRKMADELGNQTDVLLQFVNRIAAEVAKKYPGIHVHTFAYQYTAQPPKTVVPADNVMIQLCTLTEKDLCLLHSYDDDECRINGIFLDYLKGWADLTDNLYIWDYTTDFWSTLCPVSNYYVIRDNIRLFYEYGVKGIFSQGQMKSGAAESGPLRSYLISRMLWEPDMSEEEYEKELENFMKAYYGDGWEYVLSYMKSLTESNAGKCVTCYSKGNACVNTQKYRVNIAEYDRLWDMAEEAVSGNARALSRVKTSRLQHLFVKLSLEWRERYYEGDESSKRKYVEENTAFLNALIACNAYLTSGNPITNYNADVTQPPTGWTIK